MRWFLLITIVCIPVALLGLFGLTRTSTNSTGSPPPQSNLADIFYLLTENQELSARQGAQTAMRARLYELVGAVHRGEMSLDEAAGALALETYEVPMFRENVLELYPGRTENEQFARCLLNQMAAMAHTFGARDPAERQAAMKRACEEFRRTYGAEPPPKAVASATDEVH